MLTLVEALTQYRERVPFEKSTDKAQIHIHTVLPNRCGHYCHDERNQPKLDDTSAESQRGTYIQEACIWGVTHALRATQVQNQSCRISSGQ